MFYNRHVFSYSAEFTSQFNGKELINRIIVDFCASQLRLSDICQISADDSRFDLFFFAMMDPRLSKYEKIEFLGEGQVRRKQTTLNY